MLYSVGIPNRKHRIIIEAGSFSGAKRVATNLAKELGSSDVSLYSIYTNSIIAKKEHGKWYV